MKHPLLQWAPAQLSAVIRHSINKERIAQIKKDRSFHITCHVLAGLNLATGNIPGWLFCTGGSVLICAIRRYQK